MAKRGTAGISKAIGKRRWAEAEARIVVAAWRRSGKRVSEFATEYGLTPQRLLRWSARLQGRSSGRVRFHPVRLVGVESSAIEVVLLDGRRYPVVPQPEVRPAKCDGEEALVLGLIERQTTLPTRRRVVCFAYLVMLFHLAWTEVAYAYLDPGTGSFLLQMLLAGVFGMAYAVKLYWRQLKSLVRGIFSRTKADSMPPSGAEVDNAELAQVTSKSAETDTVG